MLLSSFSSDAIFSKSEGLDITERLGEKELGSVAEKVESDKVTLLEKKSLEENELGWAAGVTEFEKETFSRASERFKEGFSEVSHKELTLFSEIEFVTFLSLDVTVDVEGKDKFIGLTLHFDFWQGWNCSLYCFEVTLETNESILGNSILIFFAEGLELVFTLLLLHCNSFYNGTKWFVWNFSNFLKLPNGSHLQKSKLKVFCCEFWMRGKITWSKRTLHIASPMSG